MGAHIIAAVSPPFMHIFNYVRCRPFIVDASETDSGKLKAKDGKAEKQEKGAAAEKGSGRRDEGGTSGWKKADSRAHRARILYSRSQNSDI